jgi:hypothetical protein
VRLQQIYDRFRDAAAVYVVYIREAHPIDEWQVPNNVAEGVEFAQTRSEQERLQVATTCAVTLNLNIPILIDGMDDAAERAYRAWPERLYVLSKDGTVIYKGGKGPYGFKPDELEQFLIASCEAPDR